jgi:hypothetical protein
VEQQPQAEQLAAAAAILMQQEPTTTGAAAGAAAGAVGWSSLDDAQLQAMINGLPRLSADNLALALGIIRQQPGDVELLTERLQGLLDLAPRSPAAAAAAAASDEEPAATRSIEDFWNEPDEWRDVRAVLLQSVDVEEDEEGQLQLSPAASVQLAEVLRELQQRQGSKEEGRPPGA